MLVNSVAALQRLIGNAVPEGPSLEYKRGLSLQGKKSRIELLKDLAGMGNGGGGTLVYGVSENPDEAGIPGSVEPLTDRHLVGVVEDLARSGIRPPLLIDFTVLDLDDGFVLVLDVQRSALGPYMIQVFDERRYYKRVGSRTVPMDEQEVRDAYALAARDREVQRELWDRHALPIPVPTGGPWLSIAAIPQSPHEDVFDPKDHPNLAHLLGSDETRSKFPYVGWTSLEAFDNRFEVWADGVHAHLTYNDGHPEGVIRLHRDGSFGVAEVLSRPMSIRELVYALNVYLFHIGAVWERLGARSPVEIRIVIEHPGELSIADDPNRPSRERELNRPPAAPAPEISLMSFLLPGDLVRPSTRHALLRQFSDRTEQAFGKRGSSGILFDWGWLYRPGESFLGISIYGGALWDERGGEVGIVDEMGCIWSNGGDLVGYVDDGLIMDTTGAALCATELCTNAGLPDDFFLSEVRRDERPVAQVDTRRRPKRDGSARAPSSTRAWSDEQIWSALGQARPWVST